MSYRDTVRQRIIHTIRSVGNDGYILHVKNKSVYERDSYDEYGNEIELLPDEDVKENIEKIEFKYTAKNLRGLELARFSDNSERIRLSCVSQDFENVDYMKNNIYKGDNVYLFDGTQLSIDEVNHIGQTQNGEILLELICVRP